MFGFGKDNKPYKDYVAASKYFDGDEDTILQSDIRDIENSKRFMRWVQSFTKTVVGILFIAYLVVSVVTLILVYQGYEVFGTYAGIDTMITQMNETFRVVIGGYLVKSAVENAFKIGGNYFVGIVDARLRAMERKHAVDDTDPTPTNDNTENDRENSTFNNDNDFYDYSNSAG